MEFADSSRDPCDCARTQRCVGAVADVTQRALQNEIDERASKQLRVGLNHAYLASIAGCCTAKYFCRQRAWEDTEI